MKFSIKDSFSKCDEVGRKLRIWSHLLKKSLIENFIFCAVFLERICFFVGIYFHGRYEKLFLLGFYLVSLPLFPEKGENICP